MGAVDVGITDLTAFRFEGDQLVLTDLIGDATIEEVRAKATAPFVERLG